VPKPSSEIEKCWTRASDMAGPPSLRGSVLGSHERKSHLRRERLDDACDRCNPAELTRDENGGLEGVREPHAGRRIRPFPTLWSLRSEPEGSIKGSTGTAYWRSCKSSPNEKRQFAALLQSPLADSNRRPPPYHVICAASGGNPRQRFLPISAVVRAFCHRLRPLGSIKAPSLRELAVTAARRVA
jgi:hypothetical protein